MSFRKRNVGLTGPSDNVIATKDLQLPTKNTGSKAPPGVRPSPLDGRPTISSGTESFDELQSGHAGLPLGSCIMVEENGTTDFAGALLRYYAAEGAIQRQKVHVVGVGDQWGRDLPGLIGSAGDGTARDAGLAVDKEKMKIAWRYERLGEFGAGARGGIAPPLLSLTLRVNRKKPFIKNVCIF